MKKISCLLALLICAVSLAGCMRFNTTITIKKNGKMDVELLYAMMDMSDLGGSSSAGLTPEQKEEYSKNGWEVRDYSDEGYNGFIVSKKNVDIKDINDTMKKTSENTNQGGNFNISRDGLNYTLKWQVYTDSDKSSREQVTPYIKKSGGYMKFTLNLPSKPISSNATSVSNDGKTLEWDLLNLDESGSIEVTYSLISLPLIIIAAASLLAVIIAVIVIIVVVNKKKKARMPKIPV